MSFIQVFEDDIEAVQRALSKNDLKNANIFCNRIISDASFSNKKDHTIIGAILKDLIVDAFSYEDNSKELSIIIKNVTEIIKKIKNSSIELEINHLIWEIYHEYFESTRSLHLIQYEKDLYSPNRAFVEAITKFSLEFLINDLEFIDYRILSPYGVVNELSRIYTMFGSTIENLCLKTLLTYFGRYFDYIKIIAKEPSDLSNKKIEDEFKDLKNDLINVIKIYLDDKEVFLKEASNLLFRICLEWRKMFIRFMEISPPLKREKLIELPEKAKEKIREIASKVTKKEMMKE